MNNRGVSVLAAIAILLMLPMVGCGVKTGMVTTNYDKDGRVTSTVEDKAIGDPDTDYYRAVRGVAEQAAGIVVAKANAIKEAVKPEDGDSGEVVAWKAAFGALAISNIDDTTALNLAAVRKATTWKDVAKDGVEAVKDVSMVGIPVAVAGNAIKRLAKAAGDKTTVHTTGDNNAFESSKTHINNEVVTKSFAEGASPTVSATPAATTASPSTSSTVHEAAPEPEVPEMPEEPAGEFVPTEPPAHFDDLPVDIPEIPAEAK